MTDSAWADFPYGYGMPAPFGQPGFAQTWLGTEYPSGRGQQRQNLGWTCPGCQRGYSPSVRQCGSCGPQTPRSEACGPPSEGGMCSCGEPDG